MHGVGIAVVYVLLGVHGSITGSSTGGVNGIFM